MKILLTGKVNLEYATAITKLQELGLANDAIHVTDSFSQNKNTHKTLDFILKNLK